MQSTSSTRTCRATEHCERSQILKFLLAILSLEPNSHSIISHVPVPTENKEPSVAAQNKCGVT